MKTAAQMRIAVVKSLINNLLLQNKFVLLSFLHLAPYSRKAERRSCSRFSRSSFTAVSSRFRRFCWRRFRGLVVIDILLLLFLRILLDDPTPHLVDRLGRRVAHCFDVEPHGNETTLAAFSRIVQINAADNGQVAAAAIGK